MPSSRPHTSVITATPQKAAAKEAEMPTEIPAPPSPLAERHEENAPVEIAITANEEHISVEEHASAPVEPATPPQPSAKKTTQLAKTQPAKKTSGKAAAPVKGKTVPSQKSKATPSHSTSSSSKTPTKKATSSQTSSYDQKLLNEALQRLDKSKSVGKKGGGGASAGASTAVTRVGAVGSLNVEQGLATGGDSRDTAFEGYSSASPEACYIGDLIRRLQLNVRLPEPGEVKVKLSLKRNGTVTAVQVLSGKSASIKHSIEEKLRPIHFSPFGGSFSGEAEHTFVLRLSNELVWSCS